VLSAAQNDVTRHGIPQLLGQYVPDEKAFIRLIIFLPVPICWVISRNDCDLVRKITLDGDKVCHSSDNHAEEAPARGREEREILSGGSDPPQIYFRERRILCHCLSG
jgi:hypothetical protein